MTTPESFGWSARLRDARARARSRLEPLEGTLIVVAAAVLLTSLVAFDTRLRFAYLNAELRIALETTAALVGLVVASLVVGRFRTTRSLGDLGVAIGIIVLAIASVAFAAVPRSIGGADPDAFATWASLIARLIGAAILAVSAFVAVRVRTVPVSAITTGVVGLMAAIAGVSWLLATATPDAVRIQAAIEESARPLVDVTAAVVILQVTIGLLFAVAATGFAVRAVRAPGDVFARWLTMGTVLQALSRVHFVLFPSLYSDWLYTGDLLRLAGTCAWLVGAAIELIRYWEDRERLSVLEERRRLARELHDGLVQDLSFIQSQTAGGRAPSAEMMEHVATTAGRALREARLAIDALASTDDLPIEVSLRRAAERAAGPAGVPVTCSFQPHCRVRADIRHDLAMIVAEASTNAVRHGRAGSIAVQLDQGVDDSLWLMIADDGDGFDPDRVSGDGFGLTSMRQRAERVGGRLSITSAPGMGTIVEVHLTATERGADTGHHRDTAP